jgi:hypothetical protein
MWGVATRCVANGDKHIVGLEIKVHSALAVHVRDGFSDLRQHAAHQSSQRGRCENRHLRGAAQPARRVAADHALACEEEDVWAGRHEHGEDVGVGF